jgi:hypothetical protein
MDVQQELRNIARTSRVVANEGKYPLLPLFDWIVPAPYVSRSRDAPLPRAKRLSNVPAL